MKKIVMTHDLKNDTTKVLESPYGDAGAVYSGTLGMIEHFRLQLVSFRGQDKTAAEQEYLERDIKGYERILASNNEANANAFLRRKSESRRSAVKYKDNIDVIDSLIAEGVWL